MTKPKITAEQINALLAKRHVEDVFVPECKNGPTHYPGKDGLLVLDAWAMRKSWAHPATIGYEVKVTRSDFEQDQKWVKYLDYCHLFSFVCPGGMIKATDLPRGIGLLWVSQNGESLHSKIKPERREPDPAKLQRLMEYVLMARVKVDSEYAQPTVPERLDEMRRAVEEAEKKRELAYLVNGHVKARLHDAEERCQDIEHKTKLVEEFRLRLERLGIQWDTSAEGWHEEWRVRGEIEKLNREIDPDVLRTIRDAGATMIRAVDEIERLRKRAEEKEQER